MQLDWRQVVIRTKGLFVLSLHELFGLNVASEPRDMALPGLELHPLKGDRKDSWAVKVSGNWRVTFIFSGSDVEDVDYEDYH
jgi:proteic killer suppression protein